MALKGKQALFVAEYLVDLNATQAAIRAGYSAKTARQIAQQNLTKPHIAQAIAGAMAERLKRVQIKADDVVRELVLIGTADIGEIVEWGEREIAIGYDDEGRKLAPADFEDAVVVHREWANFVRPAANSTVLTRDQRALVSSVSITKEGNLKIEMHSKPQALALLARHTGVVGGEEGGGGNVQVNVFVDRPPPETREQWVERIRRERLAQLPPAQGDAMHLDRLHG